MKVTSREWNRTPDDFKSITNGQRSILMYDPKLGTCSVPVEIDDENGLEMAEYWYDDHGLTYRVLAFTENEAYSYAVQDGHRRETIQNMRRERSLCDLKTDD